MFTPKNSILLLIDVQGKLAEHMHGKDELFKNLVTMIRAAQILEVPIIHTEQAPEKIGPTIPTVANLLVGLDPVTKTSFSCCGSAPFNRALASLKRKHVIVIGIETHVCVYQTVADLLKKGFLVTVVADAVSSRRDENKMLGLERMEILGAGITSTEMIICEILKGSDHPKFREILQLIK